MAEAGCSCADPDLVPTKDENMTLPYVSGNPYSRFCRGCGRRYFCAKRFWTRAATQYVIPRGESEPVEYDGDDEPDEADEADETDDESDETDEDNQFECPACDRSHTGYPDACECGAEYDWSAAH